MSGPRPWPVDGAPWTPGRRRPEVETAKEGSSHSAAWPVGGARGPGGRGRALASWRGSMGPRIGAGSCASDWTRTAAVVDGLCISCDVDGQRVPDHRKREKSPTTTRDHRLGSKPPGGTGQLAGPAATGPGPQNLPVGGAGGLQGSGPGVGAAGLASWRDTGAPEPGGRGLGHVAGGRGSDGWGGVDRNIYAGTSTCTHLHIYIHLPPCLHLHIYLSTTHRWTTPRPPATPVGSPAPAPQR